MINEIKMCNDTPFIKRFKTDKNYYIYDFNTNRILLVNDVMYEIIPNLNTSTKSEILFKLREKFPKKDLKENLKKIEKFQIKYNVFSSSRPKSRGIVHKLEENLIREKINKEGIQKLLLESTQQCNLRCKYCSYSGIYPLNRVHNSSHMSFSLMKKSIDFYFSRASGKKRHISFYGGEPLLKFDLIKNAVDYLNYLKSKNNKIEISVRIATNGTLIHENLIDFFIKNKIFLQVSLDGPKRYHDMFRIYKNGMGSYNRIMKNLKRIYIRDPSYYARYIGFNCVATPFTNLMEEVDFFDNNYLTKNNIQTLNFVDKKNTTFFNKCEYEISYQKEESKFLHQKFMSDLIENENKKYSLLGKLQEKTFIEIQKRYILDTATEFVPMKGPCFPGTRRLFISTDGMFHMCERINPNFPIGDIEHGFNIKKIRAILNEFGELINEKDCLECWAMHFCNFCFASVAISGYMKIVNKEEYCNNIKKNTIKKLKEYSYLLEENPNLVARWDQVTIE